MLERERKVSMYYYGLGVHPLLQSGREREREKEKERKREIER